VPRLRRSVSILPLVLLAAAVLQPASATETPTLALAIKHQTFVPAKLTIPAGRVVKILINNEDTFPAEFESYDFNREKVIPGTSRVPVFVGPLRPGTYKFFNDFHPASTGSLIVK